MPPPNFPADTTASRGAFAPSSSDIRPAANLPRPGDLVDNATPQSMKLAPIATTNYVPPPTSIPMPNIPGAAMPGTSFPAAPPMQVPPLPAAPGSFTPGGANFPAAPSGPASPQGANATQTNVYPSAPVPLP